MTLRHMRLTVLAGAFLLLLLIPLLARHGQLNFLQGWYQSLSIGGWWIVSPLEGVESLLVSRTFHPPLLIGMLTPVILALLMGRVFCAWICPISLLSEPGDRLKALFHRKSGKPERLRLPARTLWLALAAELILTLILGFPLFVFLSPPGLVGRELMLAVFFNTLAVEGIVVLVVLALNFSSRRFFCRYLCPLGGLLALIGRPRALRVIQSRTTCSGCGCCDRACPLGLAVSDGGAASVYCWNCGECTEACARRALRFTWQGKS